MAAEEPIQLQQLDRAERLSVRTAAILREAIVNGTLPTGSVISIPRIAKLCGVSATPVREALIHLAEAGLVTVHAQGVHITEPTPDGIRAAFEVREAVEGMTARLAASRIDEDASAELLEVAHRSVDSAAGEDVTVFREWDSQFHDMVASLSRSEHLIRYAHNALDLSRTLRNLRPAHRRFRAASAHRHIEVAEAIARGDADEAERLMRLHVREVLAHIEDTFDADD
jgi:DNA-binding GntR family transcriptional regulator